MAAEMSWFQVEQVLVVVQRGEPDQATIDEALERAKALHREDRPFGVLVYVDADAPMPDGQARSRIQRFMQDVGLTTDTVSLVLGGQGFWAAAMRGVATAVSAAARTEMKVFATTADALSWLSARLGGSVPSVAALNRAMESR